MQLPLFFLANTANTSTSTQIIGGNGTPTGQLYVSGNVPRGNIGATGTSLSNPQGLAVSGHYAYVANAASGALSIYDISEPANPAYVGSANGLCYPTSRYLKVTMLM